MKLPTPITDALLRKYEGIVLPRGHHEESKDQYQLRIAIEKLEVDRGILLSALEKSRERIKYADPKILGMQEIDDAISIVKGFKP